MIKLPTGKRLNDESPADLQSRAFVGYCDIAESVRLYERYGSKLSDLWEAAIDELFQAAEWRSLLKVEGDALIFSTSDAADAADIAVELAERLAKEQIDPDGTLIQIRSGLVEGPFWRGRHTLYGPAINLSARVAGMALPGEILVTETVRMSLPPRFDMRLTDRGDCFLKNVQGSVRIHAMTSGSVSKTLPMMIPDTALKLLIAVLPPMSIDGDISARPFAEAFADAISTDLSSLRSFGVISGLSTRRASDEIQADPTVAKKLLGAHYILSGRCLFKGESFQGWLELSDTGTGVVIWSSRTSGTFADLFREGGLTTEISREITNAILRGERERAKKKPLPTIENYTLLIAGINLMHSLSEREFHRAYTMLETLADRSSRTSTPLAWLARWHNLRVLQGWSEDPDQDAKRASDLCRRALDADPGNALAHAMLGMTRTHLEKRLDLAFESYESALSVNHSEPLAWLLRGALHSFVDNGENALTDVYQANALSPLDPQRYYYLALTAGAHLTAGEDERALELAQHSLMFNRHHLSSWRIKAVAEWRTERGDDARRTVQELLRRDPEFTTSRYLAAAPSSDFQIGREIAKCLREAGVPE
ncbi:MAG: adenylate/guanylate cyclase domain-containing protein [Roseobacter sp.]